MKNIKLINSNNEKVTLKKGDVIYSPYLKFSPLGCSCQQAYFDKEGNEYRPDYENFIHGSLSKLEINYNKTSSWGNKATIIYKNDYQERN
jgi:hypothetical protein